MVILLTEFHNQSEDAIKNLNLISQAAMELCGDLPEPHQCDDTIKNLNLNLPPCRLLRNNVVIFLNLIIDVMIQQRIIWICIGHPTGCYGTMWSFSWVSSSTWWYNKELFEFVLVTLQAVMELCGHFPESHHQRHDAVGVGRPPLAQWLPDEFHFRPSVGNLRVSNNANQNKPIKGIFTGH